MRTRQWTHGDPEPPNSETRTVTGASGTVWVRSAPNGLYWMPRGGGLIQHWPNLLAVDGPLTAEPVAVQGFLFQIEAPASTHPGR
ncbi:hypothetical protein [Amycolatopsis sp. NPDC051903]|uniref:hypothetical protein n=1 Tax=Amycolatopsis sp. NPDC051903 TaxID=3363936 RepID=UPI00378C3BB0